MFVRSFFILTFACTVAAGGSLQANDSLYDRTTARKLDLGKQAIFGPQSGHFRYDQRMLRAAEIAQARARGHSVSRCWRYVKNALLASKTIDSYPSTAYAKQAGTELQGKYGFKKISVKNPFEAPVGAVLVYGGRGAGHVEIRTKFGFVSDFQSAKPSPRPLIGVYIKPRA
ncbi:MAG TPA: hypothetical protein VFV83_09545 [Chthoniobacteraceae bacterium]|nr:hypothetical protein [Chthoniobacteraceae bacterium]